MNWIRSAGDDGWYQRYPGDPEVIGDVWRIGYRRYGWLLTLDESPNVSGEADHPNKAKAECARAMRQAAHRRRVGLRAA